MISMPVNVFPSSLSGFGDGVIDVTDGLTVSWQFTGEPLTKYKIVIYQNDTASTQKFTTGVVTLASPFNPVDAKGNQLTFTANEITAAQLASAGIVNGYANGYKILITEYTASGLEVTQLSASAFITRNKPTLSIDTIASPHESRDITITATYAQAQGDSVYNVQWYLVDVRNYSSYLVDTGILETSVLELYYDGLIAGTTYAVKAIAETENGITVDTGWVEFDVDYPLAASSGLVSLCRRSGMPYIEVSWTNKTRIYGTPTGDYSFGNGTLRLPSGSSVIWDNNDGEPIIFSNPWSIAWRGQLSEYNGTQDVVEIGAVSGDPYYISIAQNAISFSRSGTTIFSHPVNLKPNDKICILIEKDAYFIKQVTFEGGLPPRTDLYPDDTLYPAPSSKVIYTFEGTCTYTQSKVCSLNLIGQQTCEFLWLLCRDFNQTTLDNIIYSEEWYEPEFDENTYLIATFSESDLAADINGGNGDTLYGTSIYRQDNGKSLLKHIADVAPGFVIFRDYGIKSNNTYVYYVFQRGGDTYTSQPYKSAPITPVLGKHTIMEARIGEDGFYHIVNFWSVAGNINSGTVSNNNKPNVVENFTHYPTWQSSSSNYKSSTLSALIGIFGDDNSYSDNWETATEIQALSLSKNSKFLQDMKGAFWMVEPNGAITMQVNDNSRLLPIKMSFPWIEVGDTSDLSVVSLPTDPFWGRDNVIYSTFEIDVSTGCLMWTKPENYQGSDISINASGQLMQTASGTIVPATMSISNLGYLIATVK